MKKVLIASICSLVAFSVFAKNVTAPLTQNEASLAVHLANKYDAPLKVTGPCTVTEFSVANSVKGFNPARWTIQSDSVVSKLSGEEIQELISIFDRLDVPSLQADSITLQSQIIVRGSSCGFTPYKWTASFNE